MNRFEYARPETVAEAVRLLEEHGSDARLLAGGTDLVIALRNNWVEPKIVIDLKRIPELAPAIVERDGFLSITASTVGQVIPVSIKTAAISCARCVATRNPR